MTEESSQQTPKKAWVAEPTIIPEATPTASEVEIIKTPHRVPSPPAPIFDEQRVEVHPAPSPVEEPVVESTKEARQELFDSVAKMTVDRVEKVQKNKKYLKASSSFTEYNVGKPEEPTTLSW